MVPQADSRVRCVCGEFVRLYGLNNCAPILERRGLVLPAQKEDQVARREHSLENAPGHHIRRIGI